MTFAPTAQQQSFLDTLTGTTSHIALVARAGCGKTSTILLAVDALVAQNPRVEIAVVSYNKAIATEVGAKLKKAGHTDFRVVSSSTAHALGNSLLRYAFDPEIDANKVRNIIDALSQQDMFFAGHASVISQLVGYAKQAAFGFFHRVDDVSKWYDLIDHYGIEGLDDADHAREVVQAAIRVYNASLDDTTVIDFDDMILMPLVRNMRVKFAKDVVIVDEAQDLSPARQAFIRKFVKPRTGRMIVVGDDRQAIYGFSGADADALPNMIRDLGATVLPLSVTWRCPKAVVAEAQRFVPDIQAADAAPEGEVLRYPGLEAFLRDHGPLTPGRDAVLCRNTAPLITLAYQLIRQGVTARVEGRAIGEGLAALAKRWKVRTCAELLARLRVYQERETAKLQAKGRDDAIEALHDKVDTLREIVAACQARDEQLVSDVVAAIDRLFGDDVKDAVVLCTYHRSKGREWRRVVLWEHSTRCPSRAARQPWQRAQEDNLSYVSVTRAMETLVYIG